MWGSVISNTNERDGLWTGRDWGYLFVLYILLTVIRFFLFFSFSPINTYLGLGTNWKETFFQSYGGLRGAVGIALAILLDDQVFSANTEDESSRSDATKVFGMVGGIAFLTLIFNGTFAGPLLKGMGLAEDTKLRHRIVDRYAKSYTAKLREYFVGLLMNPVYQKADFGIIKHHIPAFRDMTAEEFHEAAALIKAHTPAAMYNEPQLGNASGYFKASSQGGEEAMEEAVENPKAEETEAIASTPEEEVQLAIEFRKVFVELMRSAYQTLIENGELDGREGYATYALFEGLDFTNDAVESGKSIEDWELTLKICNAWTEPIDRYVTKMLRGITSCNKRQVFIDAKQINPAHEKTARVARMAAGLIRAHQIAEKLFKEEMGRMGAPKTEAMILEESQAQVTLAKQMLDSCEDIDGIVSHLVCSIIYNKAAR